MRISSGLAISIGLSLLLGGCSTNPATGRSQFDAFMPASSEAAIGAEQHDRIIAQYGGTYNDPQLQAYVDRIGQSIARNTERSDVRYHFTLLDSPVVNAFALPGGYVYVTRGILAVANDEAELAGVLGHEIGHITARHQASRYSQGVLTTLGATLIGAAVGDPNITRALGVGSNLYMSSYSRDQETEADLLGIRYLNRGGYDTMAVAGFPPCDGPVHLAPRTASLAKMPHKQATSPATPKPGAAWPVQGRKPLAMKPRPIAGLAPYLAAIKGMTYGDSAEQGFVRGRTSIIRAWALPLPRRMATRSPISPTKWRPLARTAP